MDSKFQNPMQLYDSRDLASDINMKVEALEPDLFERSVQMMR